MGFVLLDIPMNEDDVGVLRRPRPSKTHLAHHQARIEFIGAPGGNARLLTGNEMFRLWLRMKPRWH